MNGKIKRIIYSVCAAIGFLSSLFVPCYSSGGVSYSAADLIGEYIVSSETKASAKDFTDIEQNAWYYPYVDLLVSEKVINGTSVSTFSPDGTFTVGECSAVIARYLGLDSYAAECREELFSNGVVGAELWYSGYIQTLFDTGILVPENFGLTSSAGYISINNPEICERPIKRYEFADLITRSFDINTEKTVAKNLYPEICNNANSFITGGKYDKTFYDYSAEIADFELIPEESKEFVLKAYYNGIFNGDAVGNFNPENNLKRSEMAKVIAVITNPSLRVRNEYRTLPEGFDIPDTSFVKDGWKEQTLDREYGKKILEEAAKNVSVAQASGMTVLTYSPVPSPENYFIEARVFQNNGGVYKEIAKSSLSQEHDLVCYGADMKLVLTLRNSKNAKVEGVLKADVPNPSSITFDGLFKQIAR